MPALFVFLLKVNVALLLFCAGYYVVLRYLTFYTLNRTYLVTAILFASIYPQINLSNFALRHQQITKPVQAVIYRWQAPAEKLIKPLARPDYWQWAEIAFWTGATLLIIRLLVQLYSLFRLYNKSTPAQIYGHKVRIMEGNAGPFSFWKSIYVNPDNHAPADLKAILLHEQIHVSEWHTLDILLAELSTIFYWFNPGIWLMKKAIRENIEFITDQKILNKGVDTKQYQYSLVNVSFASTNTIVNNFNISTIKKRIIMMNAKRSPKVTLTRYALLVPVVVALLLVFSISKAGLVTKTHKALKALTFSINQNSPNINPVHLALNSLVKKVSAAPVKKNDTVRNGGLFISTSGHNDSLSYVINGVMANKTAFKTIDPNHIYSLEILPAEIANSITGRTTNKNDVLFVTTEDSETGKKFIEKITKLAHIAYNQLNNNSQSHMAPNLSLTIHPSDSDTGKVIGTSSKIVFDKDGFKSRVKKHLADTLIVNGYPKSLSTTKDSPPATVSFYSASDSIKGWARSISGPVDSSTSVLVTTTDGKTKVFHTSENTNNLTMTSGSRNTVTVNGFNSDGRINIDHLQSKLIIIDGKEVTKNALKKLPASKIEGMSILAGDEAAKKYGNKAKDGVLFITTKKGD